MDGPHRGGHHRIISCLVDGTGLRSLTCLWKRFPKPDSFRLADHPGAHGRDARYRNTNQKGGAISLPAVANQIMTGPEKLL
jgi:hypothetical protein